MRTLILGLFLSLASLPGYADYHRTLSHEQQIKGTYQATHHGQIHLRTANGEDILLPSMMLFWYATPPVRQSDLKVGQEVTVMLPEDSILRVIDGQSSPTLLGNYEGVTSVSKAMVTGWRLKPESR